MNRNNSRCLVVAALGFAALLVKEVEDEGANLPRIAARYRLAGGEVAEQLEVGAVGADGPGLYAVATEGAVRR